METTSHSQSNLVKKLIWFVVILISGGGAGYYYYSTQGSQTAPKKPSPPPQSVVTAKVEERDFPVIIETSGNVISANIVDIRPQVTNIIAKVHITEGQEVKAGDILFSLDDRADRANYEKAQALAEDAMRQYNRAEELVKQNFISKASADTALANANSAKSAANAAQVLLSYDTIRSPITGKAGVINVFPGSLVQPGNVVSTTSTAAATTTLGAMVTITQLNPINVQFTVPETYMASLLQLQKSPTGLVVQVQLGNGQKKQGKVFVVDNQVDPSIGAVKVKASLDNSDYALAPGRFVTVTLQTQILKNSLVVPSQAIISSPVSDQIYTVDEENQVTLNKIKVLAQNNGFGVVTGIKPNDRVVVEGKQNLRPGSKVVEANNSANKPTSNPTSNPTEKKSGP